MMVTSEVVVKVLVVRSTGVVAGTELPGLLTAGMLELETTTELVMIGTEEDLTGEVEAAELDGTGVDAAGVVAAPGVVEVIPDDARLVLETAMLDESGVVAKDNVVELSTDDAVTGLFDVDSPTEVVDAADEDSTTEVVPAAGVVVALVCRTVLEVTAVGDDPGKVLVEAQWKPTL